MSTSFFSRRPLLLTLARWAGAVALGSAALGALAQQTVTLLNVSYDPTRELYVDYNAAFTKYWKARTSASSKATVAPASRRAR